jgi:hypothetical protein
MQKYPNGKECREEHSPEFYDFSRQDDQRQVAF